MDHDITQPSLLSRVRDSSDQDSWREFEAKYRELLLRYAKRRGLQPADAEDVRQMVMADLGRYLHSFQYDPTRGRFRSYLGRMTRSAISRWLSGRKAEEIPLETVVEIAICDDGKEEDGGWEQEWIDHHYRLALESVRHFFEPRSVEMFELLVKGRSVEEVAAEFDMSSQAVHKVKQRIRDRLKQRIADQIREEDEGQ